jgi:hypothetical protein
MNRTNPLTDKQLRLASMNVDCRLPNFFDPKDGGEVPSDLIGAVIVRFGSVPEPRLVEGGGLVIDYQPAGSAEIKRVIFAFTELGMWVEAISSQPSAAR